MSNFLKKIQEKISAFFLDEEKPLQESPTIEPNFALEDTQAVTVENDTTSLDILKDLNKSLVQKKKEQSDEIVDSDYWWCFPGHPPVENVHSFEEIDDEKVCAELNRRIDKDEFPVIEIPDNIMKTLSILNNPEFDFGDVSHLINRSPSMAGEFIKVINSSLYSRGIIIQDLKLALPRLGKENVKALLYMYSTKMCFVNHPLFNKLAENIVDHSYATAIIASYLSQRYYPDPDGAFLAGLLHDIGKLGILKAISETYKLPKKSDFEVNLEIFDNILPALHEKAGRFLAENWKVNKTVISAIEHHHDFMDCGFAEDEQLAYHLSALVNIADTIARILGYGQRIDAVNIFSLPATIDLSISRDYEAISFLNNIPGIVTFKSQEK
ncbi:MAG: hypothetical protein A2020_00215 [Lentisphaerae bacterium GWF2_45_14]|nr:MAG: hypothetical protein A2020_00215 [Lentisphaerae bacterium GWF2_45_14]